MHDHLGYPALSPYENLKFFGQMYGVENLETRCPAILNEVGLERFVTRTTTHLFARHDTTFYDCQSPPT